VEKVIKHLEPRKMMTYSGAAAWILLYPFIWWTCGYYGKIAACFEIQRTRKNTLC